MKDNFILLDIDDCIFPNPNLWCGVSEHEDDFKIAEINIKRLKLVCEKWNIKICIISSMYSSMVLKEDGVHPRTDTYVCDDEIRVIQLLRKYLHPYIVELSSGDKSRDIKRFIIDRNVSKVIVIEDTDWRHAVNPNNGSYWVRAEGYITGRSIYKIKQIMEG